MTLTPIAERLFRITFIMHFFPLRILVLMFVFFFFFKFTHMETSSLHGTSVYNVVSQDP